MDGSGKKFLACAAFSLDQDSAGAVGHIGQNAEQLVHPMVFGNNVLKGIGFFDGLAERFLDAHIPEGFNGADDGAPFILQQGRGDAEGKALPLRVDDIHGFIGNRFAGLHGLLQAAAFFTDFRFQDIPALLTDRSFTGYAGDLLSGPVKRCNPPLMVHGENTVGNRIQNDIPLLDQHRISLMKKAS
jgi:hypothetical protein